MTHYWGAKAIVKRLGLRAANRLPELIRRDGVPCFLRSDPRCPWRHTYYASESMITAWELSRGMANRERLRREQDEKEKPL